LANLKPFLKPTLLYFRPKLFTGCVKKASPEITAGPYC